MAGDDRDPADMARWDAVEEATELLQEFRYADALVNLREILQKDASNPYAYNCLGIAFFETEKLDAARDAYRAAVRLAPNFLGARIALSHTLRKLGDARAALEHAKEALRRFPKDGEAMHAVGLAYAARGKRELARQHLEGFLGTSPEFEAQTEVRGILEMLGLGEEDEPVEFE